MLRFQIRTRLSTDQSPALRRKTQPVERLLRKTLR